MYNISILIYINKILIYYNKYWKILFIIKIKYIYLNKSYDKYKYELKIKNKNILNFETK